MIEKRIAKIYFEASVFLTTNGELYGYKRIGGKVKCKKLNADQKIAFWQGQNVNHENLPVKWAPVSTSLTSSVKEINIMHQVCIIQR